MNVKRVLVIILVLFFISIAGVSANDPAGESADLNNQTMQVTGTDNLADVEDVLLSAADENQNTNDDASSESQQKLSASNEEDVLSAESPTGTFNFKTLKSRMDAGSDTFTFRGDCEASSTDWSGTGAVSQDGIDISKYSLIEGNGHYIDLKNYHNGRIFQIKSVSSLTIKNLTFQNAGVNTIGGGAT